MAIVDPGRLEALHAAELGRFTARTRRSAQLLERGRHSMIKGVPMPWMWGLYRHPPIFAARGSGACFVDVDGNTYLDFNVVDLAMTMGFGDGPIAEAVHEAMQRGAHFLLPVEEALCVSELLAERTGVPFWQFTLSASGANTEVIRIARSLTGREKIVVFRGHYHGHVDDTLVDEEPGRLQPAVMGLPRGTEHRLIIVPFNDLAALEAALDPQDVALVLSEPALSNCTLVHPEPGYLAAVYAACQRSGTLFCLDEAHTFQFAYGGLKREWDLACDFLVLGKGLGTGVSFGLYGMSQAVAQGVEARTARDLGEPGIAAGGTTYASTIAVLAARAALEKVLTPASYERVQALGKRLASGLDALFNALGLPWRAQHLGPRSGFCLFPQLPRNGTEALRSVQIGFIAARKLWMANRGVWDAMPTAGPQVSFVHTADDVDTYLRTVRPFLEAIIR
ncbi:MAG TPA: aminotransferase class III-fold pyridoxal phosphate-dependent enzyme [Steroidobacteraceae bacterium]|nr:aminotransferase class III-fold pyridoxal phosphate-dependent enzyme [Steroidobacteraceae bacterium]